MPTDTPEEYAGLHASARRVLARLKGLDVETLPDGLRARLLAQRQNLDALVAVTTPEAAPTLDAAFKELNRALPIDELWAMVRDLQPPSAHRAVADPEHSS